MLDYKLEDKLPVHEYGYVRLMKVTGDDEWIEYCARMSYDQRGKIETRNLLRYLLRHKHTSPFEMGDMTFEVKMPLFVARQWVRHRTCSMNEVSARYTQLPEEMFVPKVFSVQATNNKQGRGEEVPEDLQHVLHDFMADQNSESYSAYVWMLDKGVAKETAREVLNLNIYTKFIWKMNIHNLMHFMNLRLDPHAQEEIRDYAELIENLVELHFPITHEAFVDYIRDSYTCSRMEVDLIRTFFSPPETGINALDDIGKKAMTLLRGTFSIKSKELGMSKREIDAFREKFL